MTMNHGKVSSRQIGSLARGVYGYENIGSAREAEAGRILALPRNFRPKFSMCL